MNGDIILRVDVQREFHRQATSTAAASTFALDARFELGRGEVLAVLGPNGSGKSTLLRLLAGLESLDRGRIELAGVDITDTAPQARNIGVVFQDYLLFPHLSALDNVAFGPRARGVAKAIAQQRAADWIDAMGLTPWASAKPPTMSGGQQQRVALARALCTEAKLLLLDEPLAALDPSTRSDVRGELRRHLADFDGAVIVVTHDPLDAFALADRVLVVEDGTVTQQGTLAEFAARPLTPYVATVLGVNLYRVTIEGSMPGASLRVRTSEGALVHVAGSQLSPDDGSAIAVIRPSSVTLFGAVPDTSAQNVWEMNVLRLELLGDRVRVHLNDATLPSLIAEVTPAALQQLRLTEGATCWASVKATDVALYRQ